MWKNKTVSVVFPTYNEKDSIRKAIEDFFSQGYVDEIIVVNNNAAEGTSEEVAKTKAKEVFEKKQGYGFSIRKGMKESKGDLIIVSEPDGTYIGRDIIKLLAYSEDFDVVFGTRTNKNLIWEGANMGFFIKWGNVFLAKLIEILYNTTTLSDVGCTMRLLNRKSLEKIQSQFTIGTSHFGVEMILLAIKNKIKFMQVPVNYKKRVGQSSVMGDKLKVLFLGILMILLTLRYRIKRIKRHNGKIDVDRK